ncbi:MAG: gene transfer agent family protein [Shewanella sp.]
MSGITLSFADGEYHFFIPYAGLAEIERKSDAAIMVIYSRMMSGEASGSDIVETIRQGLLGGSGGTVDGASVETPVHIVNSLLDRYVIGKEAQPLLETWRIAQVVLAGAMLGYEPAQKDTKKKRQAKVSA